MPTGNLSLDALASSQSNKEATVNTALGQLDAALTEGSSFSLSSGNVTVTATQFKRNFAFKATGATTAGRSLTFPALERGMFLVISDAANTQSIDVKLGSTTIALPAGERRLFHADGSTNGLAECGGGSGAGGAISSLSDVDLTGLSTGDYLKWSGTAWVPDVPSGGGGGGGGGFDYFNTAGITFSQPVVSGFTPINSGGTLGVNVGATNTSKGIKLFALQTTKLWLEQNGSYPSTPFTLECVLMHVGPWNNYSSFGPYISDGTKATVFGFVLSLGAGPGGRSIRQDWNSIGNYNGEDNHPEFGGDVSHTPIWFRLHDDGTNHWCEYSVDGEVWIEIVAPASRTRFIGAPTKIGFAMDANTGGSTQAIHLLHWDIF